MVKITLTAVLGKLEIVQIRFVENCLRNFTPLFCTPYFDLLNHKVIVFGRPYEFVGTLQHVEIMEKKKVRAFVEKDR